MAEPEGGIIHLAAPVEVQQGPAVDHVPSRFTGPGAGDDLMIVQATSTNDSIAETSGITQVTDKVDDPFMHNPWLKKNHPNEISEYKKLRLEYERVCTVVNELQWKLKCATEENQQLEQEKVKLEKKLKEKEDIEGVVNNSQRRLRALQINEAKEGCEPEEYTHGDKICDGSGANKIISVIRKVGDEELQLAGKRMDLDSFEDLERFKEETKILMTAQEKSDYIVRYYDHKPRGEYYYLYMERCEKNLSEHITPGCKGDVKLVWEAMRGVQHLHSLSIVHRDLKPNNILLSTYEGCYRAKISDFSLSKKYKPGQTSSIAGNSGHLGWIAPEGGGRKAGDIFAMGCVLYYVRTGYLLFDELTDYQRQTKIDQMSEPLLDKIENDYVAKDLLVKMLNPIPEDRPSAEEVLIHCLFWDEKKQCDFFAAVDVFLRSDRAEALKEELEKKAGDIIPDGDCDQLVEEHFLPTDSKWHDDEDIKSLKKIFTKEETNKTDKKVMRVTLLIRHIRNKCTHAHEKTHENKSQTVAQWIVKEKMSGECELHTENQIAVRYLTTAFPKILLHTFHVMKNCGKQSIQDEYYTFKKN